MKVSITTTQEIELNIEDVAKWFANLDDDSQAKFFVEVDRAADSWPKSYLKAEQWYRIGSHLRNCECSTDGARVLIRNIYEGLEHGTH